MRYPPLTYRRLTLTLMKTRPVLTTAVVLALSLASFAGIADARPGNGGSMGSRGSRTWSAPAPTRTSPYGAAPMERSIAPQQQAPAYERNTYGAPAYNNGMMRPPSRHPFLTGFAGGLLGAGLFGLMSGHGLMGGVHGFFGFIGLLIQIALGIFLVRWLFGLFMRRQGGSTSGGNGGFVPTGTARQPAQGNQRTVQIGPQDYQAFQQLLLNVQAAWSQQNIPALQGMATPKWSATSIRSWRDWRAVANGMSCPTSVFFRAICLRPGRKTAMTMPQWRCVTV